MFACRAPILNGKVLQIAVWLLESVFSGPIWVKSMRDSGIPQAVRDIDLPEPATFQPYWPQPSIDSSSRNETVVEDRTVPERLALASQGIPGDLLPQRCFQSVQLLSARSPPDRLLARQTEIDEGLCSSTGTQAALWASPDHAYRGGQELGALHWLENDVRRRLWGSAGWAPARHEQAGGASAAALDHQRLRGGVHQGPDHANRGGGADYQLNLGAGQLRTAHAHDAGAPAAPPAPARGRLHRAVCPLLSCPTAFILPSTLNRPSRLLGIKDWQQEIHTRLLRIMLAV